MYFSGLIKKKTKKPQDFTTKNKTASEIQDLKTYVKYTSNKAASPKLSELLTKPQ